MKKIMALILASVMVFSMAACGGEKTYSLDDLAVRDKESGKLIRIGDKREKVEKITGEPERTEDEADGEVRCSYTSGATSLDITYNEDGEIIEIIGFWDKFMEAEKNYELAKGVELGQTKEDFLNAFPEAYTVPGEKSSLTVRKREDSKKYKLYTEVLDDPEATDTILLTAFYYDSKIDAFAISTYKSE